MAPLESIDKPRQSTSLGGWGRAGEIRVSLMLGERVVKPLFGFLAELGCGGVMVWLGGGGWIPAFGGMTN